MTSLSITRSTFVDRMVISKIETIETSNIASGVITLNINRVEIVVSNVSYNIEIKDIVIVSIIIANAIIILLKTHLI